MEKHPKILLVDTAYPINSRNKRIIDSLRDAFGEENIKYIAWNRDERPIAELDKGNYIYECTSVLGNRIRKLKNLKGFSAFVRIANRDFKPDIIIASHWDSLAICSMMKGSSQKLVYENLDMPTGNYLTYNILRLIERRCLKKTDALIHASRFYKPYYQFYSGQQFILENKLPQALAIDITHTVDDSDKLIVSFVGGLRYAEMMKNLFEAAGNLDGVEIHLYGGGAGKAEENLIYEYAKPYSNIKFFGRYKYDDIPSIYSKIDVVWALYPSKDKNVKLAISNKFHESIYYRVPGIFAKGTKLGDLVVKQGIGFAVDGYNVDEIRDMICFIHTNKHNAIAKIKANINASSEKPNETWENAIQPILNHLSVKR